CYKTDKAIGSPATKIVITSADVATYLMHIKPVYDHMLTLEGPTELLNYLSALHAEYAACRTTVRNFAHIVHQHNVVDYENAVKTSTTLPTTTDDYSACPHTTCQKPLPPSIAFGIRVGGANKICPGCNGALSLETFRLAAFRRDHPTFANGKHGIVYMPMLTQNPSFSTYVQRVVETLRAQSIPSATVKAITGT
ncbi:hypothetical protein As57867_007490, partial [Aphanomyces stellatus]